MMPDLPLAERWFDVTPMGDAITLLTEPHAAPYIWSNIWHVRGRDRDLLIDTGNGIGALRPVVEELSGGRPVIAVATHSHFDHIGGLHEFDVRWCHSADAPDVEAVGDPLRLLERDLSEAFVQDMAYYGYEPAEVLIDSLPFDGFDIEGFSTRPATVDRALADGDEIRLGDRTFEVLHVPGHTPGSIALWDERSGALFTGDTVYVDDAVHAEDPGRFAESLARLRGLPVEVVHGGHNRSFGREELVAKIDATLAGRTG